MSVYAIGDPHLSLGCDKEMNIFAGWHDYVQRLEQNWREHISPEDTVILAGDISWAMNMEDALADFTFLHGLPGEKYLMKGNHDYWWTTVSSMQRFLDQHRLNTLHFLHNNAVTAEGVSLCGSRGWMFEEGERGRGQHYRPGAGPHQAVAGGGPARKRKDFIPALSAHFRAAGHSGIL